MKRPAVPVFYLTQGLTSFAFALIFTSNLIYQAQVVGLNPLQLVLVGTTLETVAFLFEIPTGVVADVYSRRLSVIIGVFLMGIGFIVEGSVPFFWAVLLNQVIWGIGITFISGAHDAWIADEVGTERLGEVLLRASQIGSAAGIAGVILSGVLGSLALALPVVMGGVLFIVLTVILIAIMPETGFQPTPHNERSTFGTMIDTTRGAVAGIRLRPILVTFLLIAFVGGAFSEGFDRLWREHLQQNIAFPTVGGLQPIVWFSLIGLANQALSALMAEVVRRRVQITNQPLVVRIVSAVNGGMVVSILLFAIARNFWVAVLGYLISQSLRSVNEPLMNAWTNQHIDPKVRATVISSLHQFDALGQIGGGPFVGFIGLRVGLRAAIGLTGLILSPTLWLVRRASRIPQEQAAT